MKRWTTTVALLIALIAGGLATGAAAQGHNGPRRGPMGPVLLSPMLLRQLNITETQREQIRTLAETHRATVEPLREQLRQSHEAVLRASLTTTFDEAAVRALIAQTESVRTSIGVAEAKVNSQVYALLTPEQRTQLEQFLAEGPRRGR